MAFEPLAGSKQHVPDHGVKNFLHGGHEGGLVGMRLSIGMCSYIAPHKSKEFRSSELGLKEAQFLGDNIQTVHS